MAESAYFSADVLHYVMPRPAYLKFNRALPTHGQHHYQDLSFCGVKTTLSLAAPVTTPSGVSACYQQSFYFDYYLRIHIIPDPMNFGVISSNLTKQFSIFNSYLTDVTLTEQSLWRLNELDDGVTLTGLESLPLTIPSLSVAHLALTANVSASNAEIDGAYKFTFNELASDGITVLDTFIEDLGVVGIRSTLYAFSPYNEMTYSVAYKTRIAESMAGEQRASVLTKPYETVTYKYRLKDSHTFSSIENERSESGLPFTVPLWMELVRFDELVSGANTIYLAKNLSFFAETGKVLIWESEIKSEVIDIEKIFDDRIELKNSLSFDYENCFVMPARIGYMAQGTSLSQYSNDSVKVNVTFTMTEQAPSTVFLPPASEEFDLEYHNGHLLLNTPNYQESSKDKFFTELDSFVGDGWGKRYYPKKKHYTYKKKFVWKAFDSSAIRYMKIFIHKLQGRKTAFYCPTYRADFKIITTVESASTYILVADYGVDLSKFAVNKHFCIFKSDGTSYRNRIISVTRDSLGIRLNLNESVGEQILLENIIRVSILDLMRLDADRLEIKYNGIDEAVCDLPLVSVTDDEV